MTFDSIWLILLFPLAGFLINGLFGRWLPKSVAGVVGAGTIFASAVMAVSLFLKMQAGTTPVPMTYTLFDWIKVGGFSIPFAVLIDPLSIVMLLIVTGVGFLIHLYSIGYMWKDEGFARFFAYLNLFTFSMLLLVMGNNFALLFIGWEGVGLCSYLLIGFWFKNNAYNKAAVKAFVMNRIGDLGFLLGIFLIVSHFGSLVFTDVFESAKDKAIGEPVLVWIALLLFVGAVGKSAQIPLYTWLPDAMAGPTPVSALIHAATMVIAGVYMVIRSNVLYTHAPLVLDLIAVVGIATALLAALIALTQTDIKKVLAYSTVSQLGYMFVALGVGAYTSSLFHVITHAFFKALLFLAAGSVIHALHHEQDIRKMGGLRKSIPITYWTFLIGTLAIASLPPFSGFFSKDEILLHLFEHNKLIYGLALLGSFLTSFYMFRLLFLTFHGEFRGTAEAKSHIHESPWIMTLPLLVLAILSLASGIIGLPELVASQHWLKEFLAPVLGGPSLAELSGGAHGVSHATELNLIFISVGISLLSIALAYGTYMAKKTRPPVEGAKVGWFYKLSLNKFYVDEIYDALWVKPLHALSGWTYRILEILAIDGLVNSVGKSSLSFGGMVRRIQTGNIGLYLLLMVVAIAGILFFAIQK